jgi:hypothetical protein
VPEHALTNEGRQSIMNESPCDYGNHVFCVTDCACTCHEDH